MVFLDLFLCLLIFSGAAFSQQTESKVTGKTVKEEEDVVLDCALNGRNIKDEVFDWKKDGSTEVFLYGNRDHYLDGRLDQDPLFKDRVSFFPEQLAVGNASIVIRKAQVKDSGTYICIFPFHKPMTQARFELTVEWILKPRNIPGAARQPFTSLNKTTHGVLLQCSVHGAFPKPRLEWLDSSGNILPAESTFTQKDISFDVFLHTTVTKSGFYRCVASQEEIHNRVFTETYVPGAVSGFPNGVNVPAAVLGVVVVLLQNRNIY